MFGKKKYRVFNSRIYDVEAVRDRDEFEFLMNTLGSLYDVTDTDEFATARSKNKVTIHISTKDKTLIKWLLKFGFNEAE